MNPSVPTLLLTGFLGSGKTTLINRWLHAQRTGRLGVVINEFGSIGIDSTLLGPGDIVELGGGCVCCATGTELWEAADTLVTKTQATQLIVETSGIADPSVLLAQYQALSPEWQQRFDVRGVLCVVDPTTIDLAVQRRVETIQQLKASQRFLFTKMDLVTSAQLIETHRLLDQWACSTERAQLSKEGSHLELLNLLSWAFSPLPIPYAHVTHHHPGNQLSAFPFTTDGFLLREPLEQLFVDFSPHLLRVKGVVCLWDPSEPSWYNLQWVSGKLEWTRIYLAQPPQQSTLLLIGEELDEFRMQARLSGCCVAQSKTTAIETNRHSA